MSSTELVLLSRQEAKLKPPRLKPRTPDLSRVGGFSLHCQGDANMSERWMKRELYWVLAVQRFTMKYGDVAYCYVIDPLGAAVVGRGLDKHNLAEGALQRNPRYGWDFPTFVPQEWDGQDGPGGSPYFISICFANVGLAKRTVRPYYLDDVHGNQTLLGSTKGEWVAPTPAALQTADLLIPHIRSEMDRPDLTVHGHGGHRIKACPGPYLWTCIRAGRWAPTGRDDKGRFAASKAGPRPTPKAKPKPEPDPSFEDDFREAVALGITDGTRRREPCPRDEAAVMVLRGQRLP